MSINLYKTNLLQMLFKFPLGIIPLKRDLFESKGGQNANFLFGLVLYPQQPPLEFDHLMGKL